MVLRNLLRNVFSERRLAGQNDTKNAFSTACFEYPRAFFEGGAGGGDVVDEPDSFSREKSGVFGSEGKSIFEVFETLQARAGFDLGPGSSGA